MTYKWLNFRDTVGYVTDGADQSFSARLNYPQTAGPFTYGWSTASSASSGDRASTNDPRLAGNHSTTSNIGYRIDLPNGPGVYRMKLALGRVNANATYAAEIMDGGATYSSGASLFTVGGPSGTSVPSGQFMAADGTVYTSAANWVAASGGAAVQFTATAGHIWIKRVGSVAMSLNAVGLEHVPTLTDITSPGARTGSGAATGEKVGALSGSQGGTLALGGPDAALFSLDGLDLEVAGTITYDPDAAPLEITVTETNAGYAGSPKTSTILIPVVPVYEEPASPPSDIWPGSDWSGTPLGSGVAPTDVSRTTAKPTLKLRDFPHLVITADKTITVGAHAKGGLRRVECHCEGRVATETAPRQVSYVDENGVSRTKTGYSFNIDYSAFSSDGDFDLYFKAYPNDATMQPRVIGPYRYHRKAQRFDATYTVDPDNAVTSTNFHDPIAAVNAANLAGKVHPLILFKKTGDYDYSDNPANNYDGATSHWIWFECDPGVTATMTSSTRKTWRHETNGVMFGRGMVFDLSKIVQLYFEDNLAFYQGWNGARFVDANGSQYLYDKDLKAGLMRPSNNAGTNNQLWIADCEFEGLNAGPRAAKMVLNSRFIEGAGDVLVASDNVYGLTYEDYDIEPLRAPIAALSAIYSGPALTATISKTGANNNNAGTIVLNTGGTETQITLNTNDTVAKVVTAINGVSGWSATLLDDTRTSRVLTSATSVGAVGPFDCKGVTTTLYTRFDIHGDGVQMSAGAPTENIIYENVLAQNTSGIAHIFMSNGSGGQSDLSIVNYFAKNVTGLAYISQLYNSPKSHVFMQNCGLPDQRFNLRTEASLDAYCDFSNNLFLAFDASELVDPTGGGATGDNNVLLDGDDAPPFITNSYLAADKEDLFVDYADEDFTPSATAELTAFAAFPQTPFDLNGDIRGRFSAVGAFRAASEA